MKGSSFSKGMSILEVIIGASIILILTTAIAGAWQSYIVITRISNERTQAALLIEETSEALQFLRDSGWATNIAPLALNTTYYLNWNGSTYIPTTSASLTQNVYTRTITFSSVIRDGSDNISGSGVIDTNTRKVTISVSTNQTPPEVSVQTEMLIHDVYDN